jgi:hypothetical protein
MNYISKTLLAVLVVSFAIPGLLFAGSVKNTAGYAGMGIFRELILQTLASSSKKRAFDSTYKIKGYTVINNEIILDSLDNAAANAFILKKSTRLNDISSDLDPKQGAWGGFKGYIRSLLIANVSKIPVVKNVISGVTSFAEKNTSKEVLYTGTVLAKAVTRIVVDYGMEQAKAAATGESPEKTRVTLVAFELHG